MWRESGGTYAEVQSLTGHSDPVSALAFDPGTHTLFSGSGDKSIKVWRESGGTYTEVQSLTGHSADVNALAFDPGTHTLFSGSFDRSIINPKPRCRRRSEASDGHGRDGAAATPPPQAHHARVAAHRRLLAPPGLE